MLTYDFTNYTPEDFALSKERSHLIILIWFRKQDEIVKILNSNKYNMSEIKEMIFNIFEESDEYFKNDDKYNMRMKELNEIIEKMDIRGLDY